MSIKEQIQLQRLEKRQRSYARLAILLALLAALCIAAVLVLHYRAGQLRQGRRSVQAQPDRQEQQLLMQERAENLRLEEEVQALRDENGTLREQVESLGAERDQARQGLQSARQQVRQLEERADWRRLRASQKESITQILKEHAGSVLVASVRGDAEARQFARQLHDAIQEAGWLVQFSASFEPPAEHVRGLAVLVRNRQNPPEHAGLLQSALEQNGFKAPGGLAANAQAEVTLLVGPRP
ncbi:MAG TPA: hypothetical protein VLV83_02825 [Acidobacteriota bacterium]|nr:hypothetical protein [Acidobacteriota bacterium]